MAVFTGGARFRVLFGQLIFFDAISLSELIQRKPGTWVRITRRPLEAFLASGAEGGSTMSSRAKQLAPLPPRR